MENLLFMSFTEKDNFCLAGWAVVISSFLQQVHLKLVWRVIWFCFQRDGETASDFLLLFTERKSRNFLPDS